MTAIEEPELKYVRIFLLPGGLAPIRQTDGAIGYDVAARVVVCPFEMDKQQPHLRKMLFNFKDPPDDPSLKCLVRLDTDPISYVLHPGDKVLIGIGFITELTFPWFYWVAPRSGLATKNFIQVTNAPGTIDSDYRGEAAACLHNYGKEDFYIHQGMRIAQIIFQKASTPEFNFVTDYNELTTTIRGSGGFGSTGV